MIHVIRTSDAYLLLASLHSVNYFHFCFHHHLLVLLSSTRYITTAFTLASAHPGLEVKILYYCTLYSKVHKSTTNCRGYMHVTMYARHVN